MTLHLHFPMMKTTYKLAYVRYPTFEAFWEKCPDVTLMTTLINMDAEAPWADTGIKALGLACDMAKAAVQLVTSARLQKYRDLCLAALNSAPGMSRDALCAASDALGDTAHEIYCQADNDEDEEDGPLMAAMHAVYATERALRTRATPAELDSVVNHCMQVEHCMMHALPRDHSAKFRSSYAAMLTQTFPLSDVVFAGHWPEKGYYLTADSRFIDHSRIEKEWFK